MTRKWFGAAPTFANSNVANPFSAKYKTIERPAPSFWWITKVSQVSHLLSSKWCLLFLWNCDYASSWAATAATAAYLFSVYFSETQTMYFFFERRQHCPILFGADVRHPLYSQTSTSTSPAELVTFESDSDLRIIRNDLWWLLQWLWVSAGASIAAS